MVVYIRPTCFFLKDNDPELTESFLVNLTSVQLLGNVPASGAAPSIKHTAAVTTVYISENDDARGVIQFNVQRVSAVVTSCNSIKIVPVL